uniref:Uncharacterized protein n=1 Tax=Anguilla anguilla TaxID=7936 RepID=A0A0E9RX38_ANGAN
MPCTADFSGKGQVEQREAKMTNVLQGEKRWTLIHFDNFLSRTHFHKWENVC